MIAQTFNSLRPRRAASPSTRIAACPSPFRVAITGGKGGVGKSTIAVNLAIRLAAAGKRVTLVDFDGALASVGALFNLSAAAPSGLRYVAADRSNAAKTVEASNPRAPAGECATSEFVIYDCGSGSVRRVAPVATQCDLILVVSSLHPFSVTNAYAMIKALRSLNCHQRVRWLASLVESRCQADDLYERVAGVTRKFLNFDLASAGYVVQDHCVEQAVRSRRPTVVAFPRSPIARCFTALATRVMRERASGSPALDRAGIAGLVDVFL
jgi:flagellar biosynthesis protein FlhG